MTTATAPRPPARPSGGQLLDPARLAERRRDAHRVRAKALLAVAEGQKDVMDVVKAASTDGGRPLLRLSLRQLLLAQPGVGPKTVRSQIARLTRLVGSGPDRQSQEKLTVQWLLDPRAHGRRMLAFLDVTARLTGTVPWAGFPFAPSPGNTHDHAGGTS